MRISILTDHISLLWKKAFLKPKAEIIAIRSPKYTKLSATYTYIALFIPFPKSRFPFSSIA
jgi:hypothetical protein